MAERDGFFTWFQSLDRRRLFSKQEVELMSEAWHSRDEEVYRLVDEMEEITKDCNRNFGEVQRLREELAQVDDANDILRQQGGRLTHDINQLLHIIHRQASLLSPEEFADWVKRNVSHKMG